jgi:hypothetical protein
MLPQIHLLISPIFSFLGFFFYNNYLFWVLFFFAAVLIDFDHYLLFVFKKKDLNPFHAYDYCRYVHKIELDKSNQRSYLLIFHTIEFFIILFVLALFFRIFQPILFGVLFHEFTDLIYEAVQKDKKYKRAFSLVYYVCTIKKNLKSSA